VSAPPTPVAAVVVDRGDGPHPRVRPVLLGGLQVVLIRTVRTYLQSVVGLFIAAAIAQSSNPVVVAGGILGALELAAVAGTAPAIVAALQNTIELLAKLDTTAPELRG